MCNFFKNLFSKKKREVSVQGAVIKVSQVISNEKLLEFKKWLAGEVYLERQKKYDSISKFLNGVKEQAYYEIVNFPLDLEFDLPNAELMKFIKTLKIRSCKISSELFSDYINKYSK